MSAPSELAGGTQLATGSEDTLATIAVPRNCVLRVDTGLLPSDGAVRLRVYVKTRSGSTSKLLYDELIGGVQLVPVYDSPPVASPHQMVATLQQLAGSAANFEWAVIQV